MTEADDIEKIIEKGLAELYKGLYRLRKSGQYQREYDTMGVIIRMFSEDRQHLRQKYKVEI